MIYGYVYGKCMFMDYIRMIILNKKEMLEFSYVFDTGIKTIPNTKYKQFSEEE